MTGHGSKFGRKQEAAIAALLTQRNVEEAAKSIESYRIDCVRRDGAGALRGSSETE